MKRFLPLLILTGLLFGQDVLTTAKGNVYKGRVVGRTSDSVLFHDSRMLHQQKIPLPTIMRLVLADGTLIVNFGEFTDGKVKVNDVGTNDVGSKLRPRWNFHEPKDPFKSGMLSAIVPSGGHFYNEQYSKGWGYLIGVPLLYLAGTLIVTNNSKKNSVDGVTAGVLVQFSALILHFYNVYDAVISSNEINEEYLRKYLLEEKASKQPE